jgi:hypothetical protein
LPINFGYGYQKFREIITAREPRPG